MKLTTFISILSLVLATMKTSGSYAQCAPALQLEKITPTTNFYDFNGAAADGNVGITSITPATGSNGGLGWTGSGTGSVFATSASLAFVAEVVTQTMSRPVADANLDGNGAVVTIVIRPGDGINTVGTTANSEASAFRIIYGGVTYATFQTVFGPTTNATITTAAGATSSAATIPANGAFITVTFTLPATIPNTGTFSLQFQSNSPNANNAGDDYSVRTVSFKSCPTSISGNVVNDSDGPTGGVNGTGTGGPGSAIGQLHAVLVGPVGTVFASVPVAADGSYSFTDNIYTSDNYSVRLSTTAGTVGAAPPAPGLPPTWFAVSETDNSPDLLQTVTVADANNNNLVGFNFGISQLPPVATDDSDTGNTPGADAVVNLLANDDLSDGSQATPANTSVALIAPAGGTLNPEGTVTVPGQGVWTYDPATGDLIFNPDAGFTGDPTPVSYTLTETATGLIDNANVTVDYTQVMLADYGDLPYSGATVNYPKVKAAFTDADNNNVPDDAGAVWLGTVVDGEADGFTNPVDPADYGKGDDKSDVADEDGLKVNGLMQPGTVAWTITANSNQPSTVHYGLWLDWGTPTTAPDGTFDNFYSGSITTASPSGQAVSIAVPSTFLSGSLVNARLIVSPSALDQTTGFNTDLANGEIEDYQFSFDGAMPVRLVSFQAKVSESGVELDWKATDQENFDRYEVERSLDGKNFGKIGEVASNNQAAGTYVYSDRAAADHGSQLYYRLKMIDRAADRTDGSFSYSVMRSVRFGDAPAGIIYPNPVTDRIYFRVSDWNLVKSVTIYNLAGLQVYNSGPVASGMVDASGLGSGMHILQIRYKDGSFRTQKFVRFK